MKKLPFRFKPATKVGRSFFTVKAVQNNNKKMYISFTVSIIDDVILVILKKS